MQCLPGSTLPAEVAEQFDYAVTEIGETERILPAAITEEFMIDGDGKLQPLTEASRPITAVVYYARIVKVWRYAFHLP
jgi:hypothetical protein